MDAYFKVQLGEGGKRRKGRELAGGGGVILQELRMHSKKETCSWEPSSERFTELTTETPRTGLQPQRHRNCEPQPAGVRTSAASSEEGLPMRTRPHQAPPPLRPVPGARAPSPAAPANPARGTGGAMATGPQEGLLPAPPRGRCGKGREGRS